MERDLLFIGTQVALLQKYYPDVNTKEQILQGIRIAKELNYEEAISREAGSEPTSEFPIVEINSITTSSSYQTVAEHTISAGRTAVIAKMEMACLEASYPSVLWRITINDLLVFEDKVLPTALTIDLAFLNARGGKLFKIEAKASSGTPVAWADITGKEIV